jgi:drug/metabolite transporter (DMT)-like permease
MEVSLEQALAASTPAFTALLGVALLGKREKWRVW